MYLFEDNQTDTVRGESKSFPYDWLRAELFKPDNDVNKSMDTIVIDLAFVVIMILLSELWNEKKATAEYLSILYGRLSFLNTSDKDHKSTLRKIAVNHNAEHPFGALTGQLQIYGLLVL